MSVEIERREEEKGERVGRVWRGRGQDGGVERECVVDWGYILFVVRLFCLRNLEMSPRLLLHFSPQRAPQT